MGWFFLVWFYQLRAKLVAGCLKGTNNQLWLGLLMLHHGGWVSFALIHFLVAWTLSVKQQTLVTLWRVPTLQAQPVCSWACALQSKWGRRFSTQHQLWSKPLFFCFRVSHQVPLPPPTFSSLPSPSPLPGFLSSLYRLAASFSLAAKEGFAQPKKKKESQVPKHPTQTQVLSWCLSWCNWGSSVARRLLNGWKLQLS